MCPRRKPRLLRKSAMHVETREAYLGTRGRAKANIQSTDKHDPDRTDTKRRVEQEARSPTRRDNQRRPVPDTRPPLRRGNRADAIDTRQRLETETRRAPTRRRNAPRPIYCVCKTRNPRGYMVQCDACADWFHPRCVGITDELRAPSTEVLLSRLRAGAGDPRSLSFTVGYWVFPGTVRLGEKLFYRYSRYCACPYTLKGSSMGSGGTLCPVNSLGGLV